MTYEEILPLVRREKFVPLRVALKDGRTYDMREFGQFALVQRELLIGVPYERTRSPGPITTVRIQYPDIQDVFEIPETERRELERTAHGSL